jgi:hypothetical protein
MHAHVRRTHERLWKLPSHPARYAAFRAPSVGSVLPLLLAAFLSLPALVIVSQDEKIRTPTDGSRLDPAVAFA